MIQLINRTVQKLKVMQLKSLFSGKINDKIFQFDFVSLSYNYRGGLLEKKFKFQVDHDCSTGFS